MHSTKVKIKDELAYFQLVIDAPSDTHDTQINCKENTISNKDGEDTQPTCYR